MDLTQAQVRGLVGITEEQFRSWRNALLPLKGRAGQTPQFGLGDVLALLVVAELVDGYGAKVSKLTNISQALFELCDQFARSNDMSRYLIISPHLVQIMTSDALSVGVDAMAFIVPFRLINARMQAAIFSAHQASAQLSLAGI